MPRIAGRSLQLVHGGYLCFALQHPWIQRVDSRTDSTHYEMLLPHSDTPLLPSSPDRLTLDLSVPKRPDRCTSTECSRGRRTAA